eukprot:2769157-Pleurochrysis_carterae.AAC.1
MLRLAAMRIIGVNAGDDASQDAGDVEGFLRAAAGGEGEADAIQAALAAAAAADSGGRAEEGTAAPDAAGSRLAQAGRACVAALRGALDALGAVGAAE